MSIASLQLSSEQGAVRSPGVHVSAIVNYMSTALGRRDNDFTAADLDNFAIFGRMWEAQLAAATFTPPRFVRPGEIERDGIIGSPDGIDTRDWSVHEYKCTWKSSNRPIDSFREYWWQIMAYCYLVDTGEAVLYPVFVCGNWRPPSPKADQAYRAEFTVGELRSNWDMLRRQALDMETLRATD